MFTHTGIDNICRRLTKHHKTNNPFEIARELGVQIEFDDIHSLKGYYCVLNRVRMIVINNSLEEPMRQLVCAHELGHDRLHYSLAVSAPLRDSGFHSNAVHEIEANRFAAGLLIPDDGFMEYASYGYSYEQLAMQFNTYPEIVCIKMQALCSDGVQLRMPDMPKSGFLSGL